MKEERAVKEEMTGRKEMSKAEERVSGSEASEEGGSASGVTELVFIIDKSGSMDNLVEDTVGGFNSTLRAQRELEGEVLVSTVLFSNASEVLYDRVRISEVKEMTARDYRPSGCTALLDAVGGAIHHIGNIHKYARREDVPEKTMFVIITDGMENASRNYGYDTVKAMIERQKERYGWEFLFLAANIDTESAAARIGISADRAASFDASSEGMMCCYRMSSEAIGEFRRRRR